MANSKTRDQFITEDFDVRFQRAFGLLAFSVNRHIVDHMRRICIELSMDPESAQIWGSLAHMNVLPNLPLGADPMVFLDELGRKNDMTLVPIRLTELTQITGLPRETVRRKLENLRKLGKVERTDDGKWFYLNSGVTESDREFTRNTVKQLLMTAQSLLSILDMVDTQQVNNGSQ
ncbi:hypothetical protein [uncultured Dechloromonas sp.]|uniref:hypothetical protein n=1 Tax=uncultured Dechloromonas sp. TaxID=171719 RepID=UPI0025FBE8A9|nr:hypothetical protein [uncultured Dechloromonas sp.]